MPFPVIAGIVAFVAGAIAAVTGFGIGSILTPLLGLQIGVKLAVAAVTIPHFAGNALRLWTLRDRVDRQVLKTFGVMSAAGSLAGAMMHAAVETPQLRIALGVVLVVAGLLGVTGLQTRIRFGRVGAWVAGGVSGFLGGMVGNQGGIRAAAMLAFDVPKEAFVATAVATALIVDLARMPVYIAHEGRAILNEWPLIAVVTLCVAAGTLVGRSLLGRIPERLFRRFVAGVIVALGVALLVSR